MIHKSAWQTNRTQHKWVNGAPSNPCHCLDDPVITPYSLWATALGWRLKVESTAGPVQGPSKDGCTHIQYDTLIQHGHQECLIAAWLDYKWEIGEAAGQRDRKLILHWQVKQHILPWGTDHLQKAPMQTDIRKPAKPAHWAWLPRVHTYLRVWITCASHCPESSACTSQPPYCLPSPSLRLSGSRAPRISFTRECITSWIIF